jgi:hypothetical protein
LCDNGFVFGVTMMGFGLTGCMQVYGWRLLMAVGLWLVGVAMRMVARLLLHACRAK